MIYNPPGQNTGGFATIKSYNFQPDIWDGVKPPAGSNFNEKAWQKEQDVKYKLTDDPKDYKKFSRTLKRNKKKNIQNLSPPKYNKRILKQRKRKDDMKAQIPEQGVLRPDLDNAIMTRTAQLAMNRDQHMNKFNIPVYENREKAKMNLMRTQIAAETDTHAGYVAKKKARTVKTAAEFSSLVKRKEKNRLKTKDLLIDVGAEKAKHAAELMRKNILESMNMKKNYNQDYDELEESDYDGDLTEIKQIAEGKRKTKHDILKTHNFQMDTRGADDYIKNILDVAGNMGKGPSIPSNVEEGAVNPKWKLDTGTSKSKLKKPNSSKNPLKTNNFVVDSATQYKSRLIKIKKKNETILKKDHAELFTKKVPNRKLKDFVEQRGGGRGGLMGVYDAYSELKKQGFKGKFLDDEETKFDRNKPKHMQKLQKKEKAKRSWKQIANKAEQLSKVRSEIPREVAKKWVDGVLRYQNVEDLLKDAEDRIASKETNLKKQIRRNNSNPGSDVDMVVKQSKLWADLQELKDLQNREENDKLMENEADLSYVEDVDYISGAEDEEGNSLNEPEEIVLLKNASEDEEKEEVENFNDDGEEEEGFQTGIIEEDEQEEDQDGEEEDMDPVRDDEQSVDGENFDQNEMEKSEIENPNEEEPEDEGEEEEEYSMKPKPISIQEEDKPASPETEMTPTEKTDQMIKQMKQAQQDVNKNYKNKIAEVESQLQNVKDKLNSLQSPLEAEKKFYEQKERSKIDQFMRDKNINATKRRIRYGMNMIESIKTSVTSINVNKAIDLKDSYDKIRSKFRHLEQPVPQNNEFNDFYVKSWQKRKEDEEKKKFEKLQQMTNFLSKKKEEEKEKANQDKNFQRFENARNKLTDAQRNFVLSNIVNDDPDLDARKDVDHPWIDFD